MKELINIFSVPVYAQDGGDSTVNADSITTEIFNALSGEFFSVGTNIGVLLIPAIAAIAVMVLLAQTIFLAFTGRQDQIAQKLLWILGVIAIAGAATIIANSLTSIF